MKSRRSPTKLTPYSKNIISHNNFHAAFIAGCYKVNSCQCSAETIKVSTFQLTYQFYNDYYIIAPKTRNL